MLKCVAPLSCAGYGAPAHCFLSGGPLLRCAGLFRLPACAEFVLGWHCWQLWQENAALRANVLRFESDYQGAQATAERLEHLEELLREEDVQGRDLVLRRLGGGEPAVEAPPADRDENGKSEALRGAEGPGHEDFPAIDLDYVKVGNVQVRALRGGKLRLALDLRNTDNQRLASGSVSGTLITADGAKHPLSFDPENVGEHLSYW